MKKDNSMTVEFTIDCLNEERQSSEEYRIKVLNMFIKKFPEHYKKAFE